MTANADKAPPWPSSAWSGPWLFFCLVFGWSWAFWIATAAAGISVLSTFGKGLELVGLLGPMLGGIGFAYFTQNREGWRDYWSRIVDPTRIPPRWYLIIVLFGPGLWAVAVALDVASGDSAALAQIGKAVAPLLATPSAIFPLVLWTVCFGPIPEELGWRGYALDRLQARWNALAASLILGAIWALYHLPLFYMKDTYHNVQGAWSLWFWLFMAEVVAMAVLFTWIFNNTRRSTLAAILFHFVLNLTAQLVNVTPRTNVYATLLWIVAAIVVVGFCGAATLTRHEQPRPA